MFARKGAAIALTRLLALGALGVLPLVVACDREAPSGPSSLQPRELLGREAAQTGLRAQRALTMEIGLTEHGSHYTAEQLIAALMTPSAAGYLVGTPVVSGAHFQATVFGTALQGFEKGVALSTGDATQIPGDATNRLSTGYHPDAFETGICFSSEPVSDAVCLPGTDPLGSPEGAESFDVVTLRVSFDLPANAQTLRFDWRFGSEEPPDNVNTGFADYFRAFLFAGETSQEIVFLPNGSRVTSDNAFLGGFTNAVGGTSLNPLPPYPDPDDVGFNTMMTETQTTTLDVSAYAGSRIELWFRLGDAGDGAKDSGVLLANLDIGASNNQPPVADAGPDVNHIECAGPSGGVVTLDGSGSSDPDGDPLTFEWLEADHVIATGAQPTVVLPLGHHTLTLRVTDGRGGFDTDEVTILIKDTQAPELLAVVTPGILWPPNHQYVPIQLQVHVADACQGAAVPVTATAWSSEPDEAIGVGDGHHMADIRVWRDDGQVRLSSNLAPEVTFDPATDLLELRAERDGTGAGRTYTLTLVAQDQSGNASTVVATVFVPHDQGAHTAGDGPGAGQAGSGQGGGWGKVRK